MQIYQANAGGEGSPKKKKRKGETTAPLKKRYVCCQHSIKVIIEIMLCVEAHHTDSMQYTKHITWNGFE